MKKRIEISNGVKQKDTISLGKILGILVFFFLVPAFASAETWNYTALGDSLAYGYGATGNYGYVERYRDCLQTDNGITVELENLGVSGWTSSDLLDALRKNSTYRDSVSSADVVTINIGGNDFVRMLSEFVAGTCGGKKNNKCLKKNRKRFKSNFKKIIKLVKKLSKNKKPIIRSMDLYFPETTFYLSSDYVTNDNYPSNFTAINPHLLKFNTIIRKSCRSKKILYANVHSLFNGSSGMEDPDLKGYIFYNGIHPNDAGYQVMADDLRALGYE